MHIQTQKLMAGMYEVWSAMIYIPGCIKIGSGIHKLMEQRDSETDTQTE
jgi:hypothetical protein